MANSYVTLDTLKGTGALNITGTAYDARLRALMEAVSRQVDSYCNRVFYFYTQAKTFDGNGGQDLLIPDLIAVGTLREDNNNDGTLDTTWAAADYIKEPQNAAPTQEWGGPYSWLRVNPNSNGSQDVFQRGDQNYQLTGTWGYWQLTKAPGLTGTVADGTAGTLLLSGTAALLEQLQTILVGTGTAQEWMYVTALAGTAATVERAKNGSTGTAHSAAPVIVAQYPGPVSEGVLIQAARLWKRKDSGFAAEVGMPEAGGMMVVLKGGLDSDVRELLAPYRKVALGIGI